MTLNMSLRKTAIIIGILLFPFIIFWRYIIPVHGKLLLISNDFSWLYYNYKAFLLDSWVNGSVPLWNASEGSGFPFFSNPFSQFFYPLNLLLYLYRLASGPYTTFAHEVFTFLGVGLFGIGLYLWLRSLNVSERYALLTVLFMLLNVKLAEILRFPNAVHAAAWLPFGLHAITLCFYRKHKVFPILYLAFVLICLGTAGYPYYFYYSIFLFGPYVLLFCSSRAVSIIGVRQAELLSNKFFALLRVFLGGIIALVILSPYLYKMMQVLHATTDRSGNSYNYSTAHQMNFLDIFGAWLFPTFPMTEGNYYIGAITVILIFTYLIISIIEYKNNKNNIYFILIFVLFFAFISYIVLQRYSYLFDLLWYYMPGFSSLRTWGRFNIVLLPAIAILLAKTIQFIVSNYQIYKNKITITMLCLICCFILIQILCIENQQWWHPYWHAYHIMNNIHLWYLPIATGLFGLIVIIFFVTRVKIHYMLYAALILSLFASYDLNSKLWVQSTPYPAFLHDSFNRGDQKTPIEYFNAERTYRGIMNPDQHTVAIVENWFYQRYVDFLYKFQPEPYNIEAWRRDPYFVRLMGIDGGQRLFFHSRLDYSTPKEFIEDSESVTEHYAKRLEVKSFNGDKLELEVEVVRPVFFSYIDNADDDWHAFIDNDEVEIHRLFGTFKTISIPSGKHTVVFEYKPFKFF